MPTMQLGALLEPGLRNYAANIYKPMYEGIRAMLGEFVAMELTSDKLEEIYGFIEAPLYFTWWPAETPPPSGTISSQRFAIRNNDFARRIYLPRNYTDEQTGTAMNFAKMIAETYALLPHEIFFQVIQETAFNATTAPYPYLVKWADGSDLYETSTRYGSSGGNTVTLVSASTVQGVIVDIFSNYRRYTEFQNTQSREFFNPQQCKRMTIVHGSAQSLTMAQAEFQTRVPWEVTSGSNGTGQTPTNILKEAQFDIRFFNSQRITATAWYSFLRGLPDALKPIWRQVRENYTEWQGNFVTSDHSRDTGQLYVQGQCREGWGGALAIGSIETI